ncbi:aldehyde dehydrogenase family protein [uncultured Corynebacterium sp.]|uniref:aldehyde dehydrogenase family protein n=1 Tax=uncultured Corynebacterium sp. TaxID=159447 RepID=UPI0025F8D2CB|nr:aldehyde dehydrogenase family protein [uncultured Corynebacterium sp.]
MTTYSELLSAVAATAPTAAEPAGAGQAIHDPATGELLGHAPVLADVDGAVARARVAQPSFAALGDSARRELLLAAADAVEAAADALAELLSREQGKPLNGPNARFEVGACAAWLRATASFDSPDYVAVDDDIKATVTYRPLGVVGAVGPWNWPMMITVWQIAPALRMGNAVVVKPSEYTPLSVLALAHVLNSVLPDDVLQVVTGDGAVGAQLTAHPDVDKIMFTGSTATGRKIVESSAGTLARLTLELGGNDAGIVLDDADPAAIAGDLFWGAFINTGQTCAAMKRLYVPAPLYDAVCEALVAVVRASPMGIGLDEDNVLGPLQNRAQFDIVDRLVKAAKDSGARILIGGDPDYDAPGNFYPATLVADIDPDNPLVVEEQFGPALPIIKYDDLDWAIEQANKLDVGLGSSVWSSNRERALEVAQRLEAGTTWINSHGGVEFGTEGLKGLAYPHIING